MSPVVDLLMEAPDWHELAWIGEVTQRTVSAAVRRAGVAILPEAEISVLLCDDSRIRELNSHWRGIDQPTNVLSFPAAQPDDLATTRLLGDIALAYETIGREAEADAKLFRDHYMHLVVHGVLHLLGYDHEADDEAERMERLERDILAGLGVADPYARLAPEGDNP